MRNRFSRLVLGGILTACCLGTSLSAHDTLDYGEIAPILQRSCGGGNCHINQTTSGVDLTTHESLMESIGLNYGGPIVVVGSPEESPLMDKIGAETPQFGSRMPIGAEPLSEAEIALISHWIEEGALDDRSPLRGDADNNGAVNLTDALYILNALFRGGDAPACVHQADADRDGSMTVTDAVVVLIFLFRGGEPLGEIDDEEVDACREASELSFQNIYEEVFAKSCAFSSCHSEESHKGDLVLDSVDAAYEALVGVESMNFAANAAGTLRVAPGLPDESFLIAKLGEPGPGEGNRMPVNSSSPLSEPTVNAIREWIRFGAPREGTIEGVPRISDEPPPTDDELPVPPVPENGVQVHFEPFPIAPGSEREVFWYVDRPFRDEEDAEVFVRQIDIHMKESSHHFIVYQWIGGSRPAAGLRPSGSTVDIINNRRFVAGSQQSFFSLSFPEGVGVKFSRNASFDFNSHYLNLNSEEVMMGEIYVNFFFADPESITTEVKPIFEINPNINVPPGQTRTTSWTFPGPTGLQLDPTLGTIGRVSRAVDIYSLGSHMHRHGVRFNAFKAVSGVPTGDAIYDNFSWDDPVYEVYDPPLRLQPGEGIRFNATHTNDDLNTNLTFGLTSEDEMAILLGYYAVP